MELYQGKDQEEGQESDGAMLTDDDDDDDDDDDYTVYFDHSFDVQLMPSHGCSTLTGMQWETVLAVYFHSVL